MRKRTATRSALALALLATCIVPFVRVPSADAVGDGSPDVAYGVGGAVRFGSPIAAYAIDVAVQPDGKSVVLYSDGSGNVTLLRLTMRGDLDPTFGTGGFVRTNLGLAAAVGTSLALQDDGKILVSASVNETTVAILRYLPGGALDSSFDDDGAVVTHFGTAGQSNGIFDVAVAPDGRITAVGTVASTSIFIARFGATGLPDLTFDGDGVAITPSSSTAIKVMKLQPDGKVVLGGMAVVDYGGSSLSWDFTLMRFLDNGTPDLSFDGDGIVTAEATPHGDDFLESIAIQPDGKIIAVGTHMVSNTSGPPSVNFEVMRFLDNGLLDSSFAGTGQVVTSLGGRSSAAAVVVQPDAKIVVAGSRVFNMVDDVVAVARFMPDGTLDNTYGVGGKATFDGARQVRSVALQPDGKLVGVGTVGVMGSDLVVFRLENSAPTFLTIDTRRLRDTRPASTPGAGAITRIETSAPAGTTAVLVNLTAVGVSSAGYITADKCSMLVAGPQSRSNANFVPDQAVANLSVVPVDSDGSFCIYNDQPADLIVDLQGTYSASGQRLTALTPTRKLDTRVFAKPAAGSILRVDTGVSAGTTAALVNLTTTSAESFGYLTAGKCSELMPGPQQRSNANYTTGRDVANLAVVSLDVDGSFCIYTDRSAHIIVDLQGSYGATGPGTRVYSPTRMIDTRAGARPATGAITRVSTGTTGSTAALVNLTMADAETSGYITADRCSVLTTGVQQKSSGNFSADRDVANAAVVALDPDGAFCIYNEHPVHLIVDVQGLI